jgi:hypothetical protein
VGPYAKPFLNNYVGRSEYRSANKEVIVGSDILSSRFIESASPGSKPRAKIDLDWGRSGNPVPSLNSSSGAQKSILALDRLLMAESLSGDPITGSVPAFRNPTRSFPNV